MTFSIFLRTWISKARSFLHAEQGMTLPLLAVSMVVVVGTVGLAIDTARLQLVQSKLQFSLDAAGLAAGSDAALANVNTDVQKYLYANFNGYLGASISGTTSSLDTTGSIISLTAQATLPTTFLGVVGVTVMTANAASQITRNQTGVELVLVLDNTGSMDDTAGGGVSKIQALKTASTLLVNDLFGSTTVSTNGKLWVGVVPFSQTVNIGTSHPTWMNATYDATLTDWGPGGSWFGCVDARLNGEDVVDDPPVQGTPSTLFEQYYWTSDNLNTDGVSNSSYNVWKTPHLSHGVTTYTYASPLNETNKGPNLLCPQQITPMTNDSSVVLSAINSMTAQGDTLINQGLVWGWNMISPRWQGLWGGTMNANGLPLAYHTTNMNKVVVLLTDGYNTIDNLAHGGYWFLGDNRAGSTNGTTAVNNLDTRTLEVCTAMKAQGIYIYTIVRTQMQLLWHCFKIVQQVVIIILIHHQQPSSTRSFRQ